jgi:hypothetical protein
VARPCSPRSVEIAERVGRYWVLGVRRWLGWVLGVWWVVLETTVKELCYDGPSLNNTYSPSLPGTTRSRRPVPRRSASANRIPQPVAWRIGP